MSPSDELFTSLKPKGPFSCLSLLARLLLLYDCKQERSVNHFAKHNSNQCLSLCGTSHNTSVVKSDKERGVHMKAVDQPAA